MLGRYSSRDYQEVRSRWGKILRRWRCAACGNFTGEKPAVCEWCGRDWRTGELVSVRKLRLWAERKHQEALRIAKRNAPKPAKMPAVLLRAAGGSRE